MENRLLKLSTPSFRAFVIQNLNADVARLLLSKTESVDVKEAADQIISRRKAKDKLPEWYENQTILFPPPLSVEQSSSIQAANYKRKLMAGNRLVDLTGGMGVDCLALGEQFQHTTYVEQDEWLCTLFSHNHRLLSGKEIEIVNSSAEEYLAQFTGRANFFIDPARRDEYKHKVFRFEDCSPDLTILLDQLKPSAEKVLVKAAPMIDLSLGITQLRHVSEVHVLSIKNEVKEVLFLVDFSFTGEPHIHCVNLGEVEERFIFSFLQERELELDYGSVKSYLYDPNNSILKAGAFKSIAERYALEKLAANTHLYTSDRLIEDFPGRRFEVINFDLKKKEIKKGLPNGKANVITKNYPLKAEALKKKLGLQDGGDLFVIGFRDQHDRPVLCLCRRC